MKPQKVVMLENFARDTIGDNRKPDLFFVTDRGVVVTVTQNAQIAYDHWKQLADRSPRVESKLENRQYGVLCSIEPCEDNETRLEIHDDMRRFNKEIY